MSGVPDPAAAGLERARSLAELNRSCLCLPLDRSAIDAELLEGPQPEGFAELLAERPHLFAASPVFVGDEESARMLATIDAIEAATALEGYRAAIRERSASLPVGAGLRTRGLFMGYDFHLEDGVPRLIEVNTNAGGAFLVHRLLETPLVRALQCGEAKLVEGDFAAAFERMLHREWALAGRRGRPRRIAIVDDAPREQYLYPDMLLAKGQLEAIGLGATIVDAEALAFDGEKLRASGHSINLVYNRSTDFSLEEPRHAALREAAASDAVVLSPGPWHHALFADKRNLELFGDLERLRAWGLSEARIAVLEASVPHSVALTPGRADALWARRRELFFKPAAGFGGRATYRGAKLTKRVWEQIISGGGEGDARASAYIAQEFVPASLRALRDAQQELQLKFDVRVYTYAGSPLLFAARVYQGQTTNFRTAGGGFAPVLRCPLPEEGSNA